MGNKGIEGLLLTWGGTEFSGISVVPRRVTWFLVLISFAMNWYLFATLGVQLLCVI